jgi:formate hydrogenlyase transcriptional activator
VPATARGHSCGIAVIHDVTGRRRAVEGSPQKAGEIEVLSRQKEDHLRIVIDTIPTMAWSVLPDGAVDFVNQRWLEYTGLSLEEALEDTTRTVHPEDLPRVMEKWIVDMAAGEPYEDEMRLRRVDGEYRWFLIRTVPLRDEQENIVKWYGTSTDIEDRKRAEGDLRRSESYLAQGQRLSRTGSWGFNPDETNDYWSRELFRIFGFDPTKSPPTLAEFMRIVHPEDRELVDGTIKAMTAEGQGCDVKFRVVRSDGELLFIRSIGVPVHENGKVKRFIGTCMDITEHEQMEQELRLRESYLVETQRLSLTGSFGWNVYSGELFWSAETFRILGYDPTVKPALKLVLERTHPEDIALVQQTIDRSSRDASDWDLEHRLLMPDGSLKHVHVVAHAVTSNLDTLVFAGAVMDVTTTKRAFQQIEALKDQLDKENLALKEEIDQASMFEEIVGSSAALSRVLVNVARVAPTDSTVLIKGATGTGKELVARAIHKRSHRSTRAFVRVNCAAIPPSLIASELFGHEKGAFTGATQRRLGRFELADGGTIFLDEVGEVPAETQVALLRVLQEQEFERVGGSDLISIDVRVVAATNRDLAAAINAGTFRPDLFYRLNVFPIQIPPLRERVEDISLLMNYFIERYGSKAGKKFRNIDKRTLELFQAYHWPGNIRELQNVIERAVILCDGETFSVDETWLQHEPPVRSETPIPLFGSLVDREREMIVSALAKSRGRVSGPSGAAVMLRMPRSTLESRIRSLRIDKHRFKSG